MVVEMQHDRGLAWRPVLSVSWPTSIAGAIGQGVRIELTNSGGGPAISCRYLGMPQDDTLETMSVAVDVPPGGTKLVVTNQQMDRNESTELCKWTDDRGFGHTLDVMGVIFAKDVLDTRYRWVVAKDSRSQPIIERVERWLQGTEPKPSWAGNRNLWPDYGATAP